MTDVCPCNQCLSQANRFPADPPQLQLPEPVRRSVPEGRSSSPIDAPADPAADVSTPKAARSKQSSRPRYSPETANV